MPNRWDGRDLLQLTRDCELGAAGETLHVVKADGPYMTVRHESGLLMHTGRDYLFAKKIGERSVDDAPRIAASDSRAVLAKLVRDYFAARDEFDACNIVAEPQRSRVAAKALEHTEGALREAANSKPLETEED